MTLIEPTWDEARIRARSVANRLESEKCEVSKAAGRITAEDCPSFVNLPTYQTSAMDGYALSSAEGRWKIIGEVRAGEPFSGQLLEGEAVSIATGAVIPEGTFGILRWENATVVDGYVSGQTTKAKDFRPVGEEAQLGEILIARGETVSPGMVGLLAAAGYDYISVVKRPRISLLLLGDEIMHSGIPNNGLVRDSLGVQLPLWLERLGCEVVSIEYISDDLNATVEALERATHHSDVTVTTGGTADGPRDFFHAAVARLDGVIHINKVAVRPGHPQVLGEISAIPLLGLPGNPLSAVVALMTLGVPLINSLLGKEHVDLPLISTQEELKAQPNFTRLIPGKLHHGEFESGKYLGSAMLRTLATADGFAVCTSPWTSLRWLELPL